MRRKQIQRILRSVRGLDQATADGQLAAAGIDPMARPETLTIEQFAGLFRMNPGSRSPPPNPDSSARS
jgi:hypothetical protein